MLNIPYKLTARLAMVVIAAAQMTACGGGSGGGVSDASSLSGASNVSGATAASAASTGSGVGMVTGAVISTAAPMCTGVGAIQPMAADPDSGAVDVSDYCLGVINGFRALKGLEPFYLQSTAPAAVCCQAAEAKTAAELGGHANGNCGWKAQAFCGGGRNPDGTVKASIDWCPKLIFKEGPAAPGTANHYTAMMDPTPRGVMCSFYGISRDRHSVVVNYY